MISPRRQIRPVAVGLILAGLTYLGTMPLPDSMSLNFHAILLGGIGSVYLGFALADGRKSILVLESLGALLFVGLATAGLTLDLRVLIGGYFGHGIWDLLHHDSRVPGDFAGWYVPFCTIYDWAVGGYLLYLFTTGSLSL